MYCLQAALPVYSPCSGAQLNIRSNAMMEDQAA